MVGRVGLITSGLIFVVACGGGGGGDSIPTQSLESLNDSQAVQATESVLTGTFLTQDTASGTLQVAAEGTQKGSVSVLEMVKRILAFSENHATNYLIPMQTAGRCQNDDGSYEITEDPNRNKVRMRFVNCKVNNCESMNGSLEAGIEDQNGNNIPERAYLSFGSFTYTDTCENMELRVIGAFTVSVEARTGELNFNGPVDTVLKMNGGPISFRQGQREMRVSYNNLTLEFSQDADGSSSWSLRGGSTYYDNFCVRSYVSMNFETTQIFRNADGSLCEEEGKLLVNKGVLILEAYPGDPGEDNYRIIFKGRQIFDGVCTNITLPECG